MKLVLAYLLGAIVALSTDALTYHQEGQTQEPPKVEQPAPLLKWVVIYEYPGWGPADPMINLRVVVKARSSDAACVAATGYIYKVFQTQFDRLNYIEVAQLKD